MIDWQSHMTLQEADDVAHHRTSAEEYQAKAKRHYAHIRAIRQRCLMRARRAKGDTQ